MITESNRTATAETPGLIDEPEVLTRVPVSRRTWGNWKAKGIVPFIRIGRRCLYHWPSVEAALVRKQRGGEQ
jgi:hypothetical protein